MHRLSPVIAAIVFLVAAAAGTALPLPARAAESYGNCTGFIDSLPVIITTAGTWCLRRDLNTAIKTGVTIGISTSDVTLDCNHFMIDGSAGGTGTRAYGVNAGGNNVSVRNCNIRGFATGIWISSGSPSITPAHLVEGNTLDGNTRSGIFVRGAGSTIRDNRVLDTGGSTIIEGEPGTPQFASGITAWDGVDVIDNTVDGVAPITGDKPAAYGIRTDNNGTGSVNGNRIRGLAPGNGGAAYGIYNHNSQRLIIRGNNIQGPGATGVGLRCSWTPATARDNVIAGFAIGIQKCMSAGDTVNPN